MKPNTVVPYLKGIDTLLSQVGLKLEIIVVPYLKRIDSIKCVKTFFNNPVVSYPKEIDVNYKNYLFMDKK